MHVMTDGRVYTSDYCPAHPQLEANFKGLKRDTAGMLTSEYRDHMKAILLQPLTVEENEVTKKYQECPKCHLRIPEQK